MDTEKKSLVSRILLLLAPVVKFIDKRFSVPYYHKLVTGVHYLMWRDKIDAGTIFLTNTLGPGSNLINPSDINHLGIYFGRGLKTFIESIISDYSKRDDEHALDLVKRLRHTLIEYNVKDEILYVLEAIGHGVIPTDLISFLTSKDLVIGKRATFCSSDLSLDASRVAAYDLGKEYDYSFSHADDTKYCFEVGADAYEGVVEGKKLKRVEYKIFGFKVHDVFLSDTFETGDWETILDSKEVKIKHLGK
jgi:hypothetical protein